MRGSAQPALVPKRRPPSVDTLRVWLEDGARTTLYVAAFPLEAVGVRVARLDGSESLVRWCRRSGAAHAVVGGFFVRPGDTPLGELRIGRALIETVPFDAPWGGERACVQAAPGALTIARRPDLPAAPRPPPGRPAAGARRRLGRDRRRRRGLHRGRAPVRLGHERRPRPALRSR